MARALPSGGECPELGMAVVSALGASQGEGEAGATQADKSSAQTVSRIS